VKQRQAISIVHNLIEEPGIPSMPERRVSHHNPTNVDSGNTTDGAVLNNTVIMDCLETNQGSLLYGVCAPSPAVDLGARSVDVCVSCSMDRDHIKQPMLAARYRKLFEQSCLDFNDRLQSVPECECGHFSIGTEHWFDFPYNTHGQPVPLVSNESTTVNDPKGLQIAHSQSPKKIVASAPLKEVRLYSKKRPVTEVPRPSGGVASTNGEEMGKLQRKRWWSLSPLMNIFETPLYTITWEAVTDDEITDAQIE
jgi:hypothetical protein